MARQWGSFSGPQVQELAQAPAFAADPGQRLCPACGERAVRAYFCTPANARRPTLVSYVWCTACHRFVGTRAAHPTDLVYSDPLADLSEQRRRELERSLIGFLEHLDALWDDGVLPQSFAVAPA